jgi:hypothetical protein
MNGQKNGDGRALIIDPDSEKKHYRSLLTNAEVTQVLDFIRQRQGEFPTKMACFREALKSVGAEKRMIISSGAATRYFQKAAQTGSVLTEATEEAQVKRKYVRRQPQPVAHEIHVNFCPNCGCNIHSVATGMAMAKL